MPLTRKHFKFGSATGSSSISLAVSNFLNSFIDSEIEILLINELRKFDTANEIEEWPVADPNLK